MTDNKRKIPVITLALTGIGFFATALFYMQPPIHLRQPFLLLGYLLLNYWLLQRHRHLPFSRWRAFPSVLLGFAWLYSSHTQALSTLGLLQWLDFFVTGLSISFTFYLIVEELERPFTRPARPIQKQWMLLYGAIPVLCWFPYLLAYYPAKMNADSFWQWAQAHHVTPYSAWHPLLDTWLIQVCASVYNSPVTYIVFQIVVLAVIIAYALYLLQSLGLPQWLVVILDLVYALNPANGFLVITMWKDILFAAVILLLTLLFTRIVQNPSWLNRSRNAVLFIIVCFLGMTLRHNGPETIIAALLIFILVAKGLRLRLIMLCIPVILSFAVFNGPVKSYFHVIPEPLNEALAIPSQQIAATYKSHGKFTPQLRSYFDSILPAQQWATDYSRYTVNPVKWDHEYNANIIYQSFSTYLSNWAQLLRLNPTTFVRAYLNQVSVLWQFSSPRGMNPYLDTPATLQSYALSVKIRAPEYLKASKTIIKGSYQWYVSQFKEDFPGKPVPSYAQFEQRVRQTLTPLKTNTRFQGLRQVMHHVMNQTRYNYKNYLVKGALPLFFMLLSLVASVRRYRWRGLVVFLPALFVIITLAMAMPATDFRYSFGFVLSVPFLFFYPKLDRGIDESMNDTGY